MPKLVTMLRVKDGIQFVGEWLSRMSRLADEIVVVDNGSIDGTLTILKECPKVVDIAHTVGFDEGRDKNLLYSMARQRKADWLIWLDVDEIFESRLTREHLERLMRSKRYTRYFFRRLHFVDGEHFDANWFWFRYSSWPDRILWREQASGYFDNLKFNNGLVRGITGFSLPTHFRLKHLGYNEKELVQKKIELYQSIDPSLEKTYAAIRHIDAVKWKWREYSDSPICVTLQNISMDLLFGIRYLLYIFLKPLQIRFLRFRSKRFLDG